MFYGRVLQGLGTKKNTQYKIKSDLNAWKQLCELLKESRATENKPANELDLLLSKFFISVRKQNGTEYEPGNEYDPAYSEAFNATFLFGHLINILLTEPGRSAWQNLVLTSLRSVCAGELGQDPPIQTSRSVNKKRVKSSEWSIINAVF